MVSGVSHGAIERVGCVLPGVYELPRYAHISFSSAIASPIDRVEICVAKAGVAKRCPAIKTLSAWSCMGYFSAK